MAGNQKSGVGDVFDALLALKSKYRGLYDRYCSEHRKIAFVFASLLRSLEIIIEDAACFEKSNKCVERYANKNETGDISALYSELIQFIISLGDLCYPKHMGDFVARTSAILRAHGAVIATVMRAADKREVDMDIKICENCGNVIYSIDAHIGLNAHDGRAIHACEICGQERRWQRGLRELSI